MENKRGKLKIFLGAVAGVGKTFKMLSEAHRRISRGEEIVIGLIESHGRPATAALLKGIEQVPLKAIDYRGTTFYEVDTHAIIARHPQYVLIDELAHTNVPGTIHVKRWQSIEAVLAAGINVITTLNVQHIESLNDAIFQLTGVRVKETVPDSVVDNADEIELVDLTPEALINRLERGDVYKGEKVPQALANFFRKENLAALRELALRRTADEVDEQLQDYLDVQKSEQAKAAHEHVVVCISPRPLSAKLVRRGYRIAKRLQANFDCIYIRVPGAKLSKSEEAAMQEITDLSRNLGGQVVELEGDSVAEEIIKYVQKTGCTMLVMGQSARSRTSEVLRGSIITKIMRQTKNMDIVIVADSKDEILDD